MYTALNIENFRVFEHLELNDLARVNLIAGKNNTGKTSLLEATLICTGDYSGALTRMGQNFDELRSTRSMLAADTYDWRTIFNHFNDTRPIKITAPRQNCDTARSVIITIESVEHFDLPGYTFDFREFDVNSTKLLQFSSDDEEDYQLIEGRERLLSNRRLDVTTPIVFLQANRRISTSNDAERLSHLKRAKQEQVLIDVLTIIESRLTSVELLSDGIYGDVEGEQQLIRIDAMGEGVVKLCSIALAISASRGGVVLIDEIENGLHYTVQKDVWKAIARAARDFDVQIFATTHSLEMIRAAHAAFSESDTYDFRLHRLDRSAKTGKIKAVTYDQEILEAAIEANFEVR